MRETRIGSCLLHEDRQLIRDGKRVAIGPRALAILSELSRHRGQVVTKDELFDAVWGEVAVEENALQVHIGGVRKALGADAVLIETVRGVGYQLSEETCAANTTEAAKPYPSQTTLNSETAPGAETSTPSSTEDSAPLFDRPSIAVLPLRHPPGDDEQAYFAEGMAEDIIAGLSRSSLLRVTSRQSSLSYQAEGVTTAKVCTDMGVRYLLRGQIRKMGPNVRVRVDLIDGERVER